MTTRSMPPVEDRLSIDGFKIGHGSDLQGKTGATVILCPEDGALAAAEVRGSATGTSQFDSLVSPVHLASRAHACVLAGGSGFGLTAVGPVVRMLESKNSGFDTGYRRVPLVPTAILFDLAFGSAGAEPTTDLILQALADADDGPVTIGSVGAGTGATVGKVLGPDRCMKGGFGFASLRVPNGPTVAAAVAVNAFGGIRHPDTGELVAGCRQAGDSPHLVNAEAVLANMSPDRENVWEGNTTLAVVLTDADLDKVALLKVCHMAFGGFYRALAPGLSLYDGDLVVALSSGRQPAHINQVGVLAQHAVGHAILRGVQEADGFGLLPSVKDLSTMK